MGEQKWATVSPLYCCDIETGPTTPMIVNMIFLFEWEKGETDDFETHVAFAWLQKRNENVCIVRESNPGRPRGRRAFYHWTNDACTLWRHHIQNWLQDVSKRNYTAAWAVVAEWLRRLTRNEFPFGSVGSNPTNCDTFGKTETKQLAPGEARTHNPGISFVLSISTVR